MRQCTICKKTSQMQGERRLLRGHYNPVNWSRKYPNLQWARVGGLPRSFGAPKERGKRVKICTGCMRTINKKATMKAVLAASKTAVAAESK